MMANYKRKYGEDRISNLPEHLLASIIERLPIQDAVRTSIISKKWRYIWTEMRELIFDEHFSNKFAKKGAFSRNGFIRIINQVLTFQKGALSNFAIDGAFGRNGFISIINQVLTLHKGPILKFHLYIPNILLDSFEEVDQWMLQLSRNGVRELFLINSSRCYELPSYVFSCPELRTLKLQNCFFKPPLKFEGLLNLEVLILSYIDFGANLCGTMFNLPKLKKLSLNSCTNVYNFNIKVTNLFHLAITTCPDAMLSTMLSNLTKVERFCIDGHFLKTFTEETIPKWLKHPDNSLTYLWFRIFQLDDLDQLRGALCLLRNSPNLKALRMDLEKKPQVNLGHASSILESLNCLDYKLYWLQTVDIISIEGSKPEMLLIKLLLSHSPSLDMFTIRSGSSNVQTRLDIAKDVMWFPRASPKAKIIYIAV